MRWTLSARIHAGMGAGVLQVAPVRAPKMRRHIAPRAFVLRPEPFADYVSPPTTPAPDDPIWRWLELSRLWSESVVYVSRNRFSHASNPIPSPGKVSVLNAFRRH